MGKSELCVCLTEVRIFPLSLISRSRQRVVRSSLLLQLDHAAADPIPGRPVWLSGKIIRARVDDHRLAEDARFSVLVERPEIGRDGECTLTILLDIDVPDVAQ